jgi:hypothetical protein
MKNFTFRQILPYITAVLVFLAITMVYFSPLLEGKRLFQSDIVHFTGGSKEISDYRAQTGKEPLWTNSMFSGMPAYQISTVYAGNKIGFFDRILTLGLPMPANLVFLYFLGFFILLLVLKVDPWLAIAGSVGFAFSSFFFIIIDVGHNSQALAIGYMAPVLAGIILTFRRKFILGGLLTAFFLSLEIKANHPQITYYLMMIILILGSAELVRSIREKGFSKYILSAGIIIVAVALALLTNITSLWATYEYGKYTIRGKSELTTEKENRTSGLDKDYATQYSVGKSETMTLLIPNFYGSAADGKIGENSAIAKVLRQNNQPDEVVEQFTSQPVPPMYWGDQPWTSAVYVGAVVVFLFVLGLFIVKGSLKWWVLAATIVSILLSWGHNFMALTDFFLNYVPGYNKFRAVSMILVIAELCIPILAIMAVREFFDPENDKKKFLKPVIISASITAGICLIFAAVPDIFMSYSGPNDAMYAQNYHIPDWLVQAVREDRKSLLQSDAFRSMAFILLATGVLILGVYKKLKKEYAFLILGALILVDMYPVCKRFLSDKSFTSKSKVETPYEMSAADQQILQDTTPDYRVLNLTVSLFNDASTSYFHKSIGGYHGAKLRRYQELKDYCMDPEIQKFSHTGNTTDLPVLNMLNARYFIIPDTARRPISFRNYSALGNAWFVRNFRMVDNADAEIKAVKEFDPHDLAVVDKKFKDDLNNWEPSRDSSDFIRMLKYSPNDLVYSSHSAKPGLAIFSEIYYPKGWNAYIDGKPAPHFRADYILRAMMLPAGDHNVEFKFEPTVYFTGEKISMVSSVGLLLLIVVAAGFGIRNAIIKKS